MYVCVYAFARPTTTRSGQIKTILTCRRGEERKEKKTCPFSFAPPPSQQQQQQQQLLDTNPTTVVENVRFPRGRDFTTTIVAVHGRDAGGGGGARTNL